MLAPLVKIMGYKSTRRPTDLRSDTEIVPACLALIRGQ